MKDLEYQSGFGNHFETEAEAGTLPEGRNNPQKPPHGLYAELFSGTSFLMPQKENQRSWLYRIQPSVAQKAYQTAKAPAVETAPLTEKNPTPAQLRWDPMPVPSKPTDFVDGMQTLLANGDARTQTGCGVHLFACNAPMKDKYFSNADGDLLILPEQGELYLRTEFGDLDLNKGEIAVVQRGIRFQAEPKGKTARGYICENYGAPLRLPDRGPIGSNGLANSRDFLTPVARYEDKRGDFKIITKYLGNFWEAPIDHSPLNVVGWHGNYAPYKYDLNRFNTIGSISYDHPDPSIFTVLTSPSETPGMSNIDFVIFPPRWLVGEDTFRPPWFHRNIMSEYMGLLWGVYDAKTSGGFVPGGGSLHNCMSPHGPDADTTEKASNAQLKPQKLENTMAFMFESRYAFEPTAFAKGPMLQKDYVKCWEGLGSRFKK